MACSSLKTPSKPGNRYIQTMFLDTLQFFGSTLILLACYLYQNIGFYRRRISFWIKVLDQNSTRAAYYKVQDFRIIFDVASRVCWSVYIDLKINLKMVSTPIKTIFWCITRHKIPILTKPILQRQLLVYRSGCLYLLII